MYEKQPRQQVVGIVGDDSIQAAYDEALSRCQDTKAELDRSQGRRVQVYRLAGMEPVEAIAKLTTDDERTLNPLLDAVGVAQKALDAATLWFTFQSLGRTAYRDLVDAHPPTDEDHARVRATLPPPARGERPAEAAWNAETFVPALIRTACVTPELSEEFVSEMFASPNWSEAETGVLFGAALDVNTRAHVSEQP